MHWSRLKKHIEGRFAKPLQGRVSLFYTRYRVKIFDDAARASITLDGHEIVNMKSPWVARASGTVWRNELAAENIFEAHDFHNSLFQYLDMSISEIIESDNVIIRAIGMLDARLGKRRLQQIDITGDYELVKRLYALRCDVENIACVG